MESIPPLLADALKTLSGTLVGLIPYIVKTYRDRKKSDLEDTETAARTELAKANARSVEIRDNVAASEAVEKLLTALITSGDTIHDLQQKNFRLEQDNLGEDMLRLDLKKAMALLAYKNIPFCEAEHPEVKKMIEVLNLYTQTEKP